MVDPLQLPCYRFVPYVDFSKVNDLTALKSDSNQIFVDKDAIVQVSCSGFKLSESNTSSQSGLAPENPVNL
jgi:hypothetical protein